MTNYQWEMIQTLVAGIIGGLIGPAILFSFKSKITAYFNRNLAIEIESIRRENAEKLQISKELLSRRLGSITEFKIIFDDIDDKLSEWNYSYSDNYDLNESRSKKARKNQEEYIFRLKEIKALMPMEITFILTNLQHKINLMDGEVLHRNHLTELRYKYQEKDTMDDLFQQQGKVNETILSISENVLEAIQLMDTYLFSHEFNKES